MDWTSISKSILRNIFNPLGIPSLIIPSYERYWKTEDTLKRSIVHEAGHAVVNHFIAHNMKPMKLTTRPDFKKRLKGVTGCFSIKNDGQDIGDLNDDQLHSMLAMLQASKAAELTVFGSLSPKANYEGDDAMSKKIIHQLYGNVSEQEERLLMNHYKEQAHTLLKDKRVLLDRLCQHLEVEHTMNAEKIHKILGNTEEQELAQPVFTKT